MHAKKQDGPWILHERTNDKGVFIILITKSNVIKLNLSQTFH